MTQPTPNLSALIGSRICHDLISPVGAIANGLELLSFAGVPEGPEMSLVADSAAHATARLRFFRVAFGMAGDEQSMASDEIRSILADVYTARLSCDWQVEGALPRKLAQAAFLAILCAEEAAPFGGSVQISGVAETLHFEVTGERLAPQPAHWAWLTDPGIRDLAELPAQQVQFALLPGLLADLDRRAQVSLDGDVTLSF